MLAHMPRIAPPRGHVLYALGRIIGKRRRARGLTQADLAAVVGVSLKTMSHYELGQREPPIETLIRISHACDMPLSAFVSPLDTVHPPLREVRKVRKKRGSRPRRSTKAPDPGDGSE